MNKTKIRFEDLSSGQTFTTTEGGTVTVIDVVNSSNITVKHNDQNGHVAMSSLGHLNEGTLKNPYHRSIYGVGYLGVGAFQSRTHGDVVDAYSAWTAMMQRCYDPAFHLKQPSYLGCIVNEDWHNYQVFATWYINHPGYGKGYHLDKDILYPGNKIYSSTTCTMVPKVINELFCNFNIRSVDRELPTGIYRSGNKYQAKSPRTYLGTYATVDDAHQAYLTDKRGHILAIAEQYKTTIDPRVYLAILALSKQNQLM